MFTRTLIAAAVLALAGCATQEDYTTFRKEMFRNDEGKVVGHREFLRNTRTGEIAHKLELYAALFDADGKVIGYEERTRTGAIVLDEHGRPIGTRMIDLRSRGTNPRSGGLVLMY